MRIPGCHGYACGVHVLTFGLLVIKTSHPACTVCGLQFTVAGKLESNTTTSVYVTYCISILYMSGYEIVMILAVLCVPEGLSQDCAVCVGVLGTQVQ